MTPDDAREQLLRALLVERFTPTPARRPEPAREPQPERGGHLRLVKADQELHPRSAA